MWLRCRPLFPPSFHDPKRSDGAAAQDFFNPLCTKDLAQLCVDTNTVKHCKSIFGRMQPLIAVAPGAWKTYHAPVPDLSQLTNSHPQLSGPLSDFFKTAAQLHNSQSITDSDTKPLLLALRQTSHVFLKQLVALALIGYLAKTRSLANITNSKILETPTGPPAKKKLDTINVCFQHRFTVTCQWCPYPISCIGIVQSCVLRSININLLLSHLQR
ncbi:hypothetical protein DFS33DRAFT_55432 [Desarmillaria ectypa]|nr:hypothetical protein DFS33DRAFT_55432 [Desarmillaria ectypa]